MTPPKGYYEEPRFEEILAAADYAYQHKTGKVGFFAFSDNATTQAGSRAPK